MYILQLVLYIPSCYEIFSPFAEDFVTHDLKQKLKVVQHKNELKRKRIKDQAYERNIKSSFVN